MTQTYTDFEFYEELKNQNIKTYIDVGSNKGQLIRQVKNHYPKCKVYAFEPLAVECAFLEVMYNLKPYKFALWNKNTSLDFYIHDDRTMSSLIHKNKNVLVVPARRFDSLDIKIKNPCLVKIDVERAEKQVIEGFGDRLKDVDILQFEYHNGDTYNKVDLGRIITRLEKYGFTSFIQKLFQPKVCDYICFKK